MTMIEALENTKYRALVEQLEEIRITLMDREDEMLEEIRDNLINELKAAGAAWL